MDLAAQTRPIYPNPRRIKTLWEGQKRVPRRLAFGQPAKPANLSAAAAAEWDKLMSEIAASGLQITPAHRALIATAATLQADIKSDWAELEREGQYHNSPKGGIMAHPALKRMDALRRDLIKTLSAIGLRPGLATEQGDGETLEDLLKA